MKSFLDKLQLVPFEEKLNPKSFLMTFAKVMESTSELNSCFKEIVNERKTE